MASSIERASEHFGNALAALEQVGGNVRLAEQLIGLLGWELPPGVSDIGVTQLQVSELADRLDALGELRLQADPSELEVAAAVAEVVAALMDALEQVEQIAGGLQATPQYLQASGIEDELFRRVGDLLVIQMLGTTVPAVVPIGILLGLFEFTQLPADRATFQVEHIRQVVRWDRFSTVFGDPASLLQEVYGWGTPDFDGNLLLLNVGRVAEYFAAAVETRRLPREVEQQITGTTVADQPGVQLFVSVAKGLGFESHDVGVTLYPLRPSAAGASDGGIGLSPYLVGTAERSFALSNALSLIVSASTEIEDGIALVLRGGQDPELITGLLGETTAPGTAGAAFELGLRRAAPDGGRVSLFSTGALSIDAAAVLAAVGVELGSNVNPFLRAAIEDGRLQLSPDRGDGFLASILPADGITATFSTRLSWSQREGLRIDGEAGLRTTLALNRRVGPLQLDTLDLGIRATGSELAASAALTATAQIGPVAATVQSIGAATALRFERGNLGPADLGVRFEGPDGVGLAIDAGVVTGGGFLRFDRERGEYAGELRLRFQQIAVRAIGLLTTRLPGGRPGYSLLVLVSAEFPPVQLGLGFMLVGVGGLLGINRTVAVDALRAGLKTGALGAVLSPPDPEASGGQFVSKLAGLFPPATGRHVFAPTARIIWGTPTLITIELALVLELPSPVRLVVLGRLRAVLPDEREAIVRLQVDMLGVIDFDRREVAVDATLVDSRLAQFALTGDMALRMSWGAQPSFLLAVGGFHPRFTAPPGFPALQRVAVALAGGDNPKLRLEAYLALTSNTVQFGARVDLGARAGKLQHRRLPLLRRARHALATGLRRRHRRQARRQGRQPHHALDLTSAHPERPAALARPRPRLLLDPLLRRLLRLRRHHRRRGAAGAPAAGRRRAAPERRVHRHPLVDRVRAGRRRGGGHAAGARARRGRARAPARHAAGPPARRPAGAHARALRQQCAQRRQAVPDHARHDRPQPRHRHARCTISSPPRNSPLSATTPSSRRPRSRRWSRAPPSARTATHTAPPSLLASPTSRLSPPPPASPSPTRSACRCPATSSARSPPRHPTDRPPSPSGRPHDLAPARGLYVPALGAGRCRPLDHRAG